MMNMTMEFNRIRILIILLTAGLLTACSGESERLQELLQQELVDTQRSMKTLGSALEQDTLSNARLITTYARSARQAKPEHSLVIDTLRQETTTQGGIYQALSQRTQQLSNQLAGQKDTGTELSLDRAADIQNDLQSIRAGADLGVFNMALTDPLNVIADIGGLPRVQALAKEAAQQQSKDAVGDGAQLVGNPAYGSWQQNSSGTSFWAFYGQYAMLRSLMGGPVYYDRWSRGRDYSYYNDRGRDYYTSRSQRNNQTTALKKTQSKFKTQGKTFNSPYSRNLGNRGPAMRVKPAVTPSRSLSMMKTNKFKTAKSGSASNTYRNSSARTSRSVSRGK